jgi:hypothetical protein
VNDAFMHTWLRGWDIHIVWTAWRLGLRGLRDVACLVR